MSAGRTTKKSEQLQPAQNRLVNALSPADQKFFFANSTKFEMKLRDVLMEPGDETEFCYFPTSGVFSLVAQMSSGAGAEIGLIGAEGMVSVNILLGESKQQHEVLVQGPGEAYRIQSSQLTALMEASDEARSLLLRYGNGFLNFVAQGAACNALHRADKRLARWILLVADRMQSDSFAITHEFIANMLGTRRATVTVVANQLEEAGLIKLGRREISILDHPALVRTSCECYGIMTEATNFKL